MKKKKQNQHFRTDLSSGKAKYFWTVKGKTVISP